MPVDNRSNGRPGQEKKSPKRPGIDREFRTADAAGYCSLPLSRLQRRIWKEMANKKLRQTGDAHLATEYANAIVETDYAINNLSEKELEKYCLDKYGGPVDMLIVAPGKGVFAPHGYLDFDISDPLYLDTNRKPRQAPVPGFHKPSPPDDNVTADSLQARERWR